jgi:hypothetical protein
LTGEQNCNLEYTMFIKSLRRELHKSNIYETIENERVIWSGESPFKLVPTSGRVYVRRAPKEAYNPECLVPTVKHKGGSVMVGAAVS